MAKASADRKVIVEETIWGVELRVVLPADAGRDLCFSMKHSANLPHDLGVLRDAVADLIREMAWSVAGGIKVSLAPPLPPPAVQQSLIPPPGPYGG